MGSLTKKLGQRRHLPTLLIWYNKELQIIVAICQLHSNYCKCRCSTMGDNPKYYYGKKIIMREFWISNLLNTIGKQQQIRMRLRLITHGLNKNI